MTETWMLAAIWLGLALIAALFSVWLRIATALSEIVVGTLAQFILGIAFGASVLQADLPWIKFLAGTGAILLTFLAGAELDPAVLRVRWKEATAVGLMSFLAPFIGCAVVAYAVLDWNIAASWLAGVALSTTSVAVVYAVMLEFGLNTTDYGKTVLAACFITDLGTVLALGFIFSPFTLKTLIFFGVTLTALVILPWLTPRFFRRYGGRPSEIEAKFLLVGLFALGALAVWADSEAVLPAYLLGMVLAGSLVSIPTLVAAPAVFFLLLVTKQITKMLGVYPVTQLYRAPAQEAMYTTLLMSTGLTFGTISALYWLSHQVIDQAQYSFLVATVIGSAVIPTLIANAFFLPRHLLAKPSPESTPPLEQPATSSAKVYSESN